MGLRQSPCLGRGLLLGASLVVFDGLRDRHVEIALIERLSGAKHDIQLVSTRGAAVRLELPRRPEQRGQELLAHLGEICASAHEISMTR